MHVWFEGNVVLLLHGAAMLSFAYEKWLMFSVKQLSIKKVVRKTIPNLGLNNEIAVETWVMKRFIADYTNTSLHGFAYFVLQVLVLCVNMLDD